MNTDYIYKALKEKIKPSRLEHIEGVKELAISLADYYGEDMKKAEACALFHDLYRYISDEEIDQYISEGVLDSCYRGNSNLAHSKIAAYEMTNSFQVRDADMINAVSYHTTGRKDMSLLEKIIFIADAAEKNRDYPGVDAIRAELFKDINKACLLSLEGTRSFLDSKGIYIDKDTLDAIDYFQNLKGDFNDK